jgi:hypothetical protein
MKRSPRICLWAYDGPVTTVPIPDRDPIPDCPKDGCWFYVRAGEVCDFTFQPTLAEALGANPVVAMMDHCACPDGPCRRRTRDGGDADRFAPA